MYVYVPQACPIVVAFLAVVGVCPPGKPHGCCLCTVLVVVAVAQIDFNQIQFMLRLGDE